MSFPALREESHEIKHLRFATDDDTLLDYPRSHHDLPIVVTLDPNLFVVDVRNVSSFSTEILSPYSVARYAVMRVSDGNGEMYSSHLCRTVSSWEEVFSNEIWYSEYDNGLISNKQVNEEPVCEEIVESDEGEPVFVWVLTEGPNGETAINGGAYRIWTIEQISLERMIHLVCGKWDVYTDPQILENAIAEKFSDY